MSARAGPPTAPLLRVLDFELNPTAGYYVRREPCVHADAAASCRSCARPLELRTFAPVVAVAAHPRTEDIVVGLQARRQRRQPHTGCLLSAARFRREAACRFSQTSRARETTAAAKPTKCDCKHFTCVLLAEAAELRPVGVHLRDHAQARSSAMLNPLHTRLLQAQGSHKVSGRALQALTRRLVVRTCRVTAGPR